MSGARQWLQIAERKVQKFVCTKKSKILSIYFLVSLGEVESKPGLYRQKSLWYNALKDLDTVICGIWKWTRIGKIDAKKIVFTKEKKGLSIKISFEVDRSCDSWLGLGKRWPWSKEIKLTFAEHQDEDVLAEEEWPEDEDNGVGGDVVNLF